MRVVRYGRGYAGGILGGAIHPEMGRRNGALSTHLDFPMRLSHGPGLWIYFQYQYGDVRATLSWHVRAAARPRHARADDTTTHTPLHSPLHSAFQHLISAGLRSPDEYDAPPFLPSFLRNLPSDRAYMQSAPTGTGVGQIGLRTRDLNSRVTEEHSRARVRDRHQLVDYHRLLGASQSASSP